MEGLIHDGAVIRRVWNEPLTVYGGGRALLMQLAHPGVAAGVADHSRFRADPTARLRHTLEIAGMLVFGARAEAEAAVAGMRAVHRTVKGPGYAADDPELQLWVHATLVDTALLLYERFLHPLTPAEAESYYQESTVVAEALGIPRSRQPVDLAEFRAYMGDMVDTLRVGVDARELARAVLHPPLGWVAEPWLVLFRQLTVGLLPARLRREYGLGWDLPRQVALTAAELTARQVLPRIPLELRRVPAALLVA
jgi:uncharacterized protein (DUF2236 family)